MRVVRVYPLGVQRQVICRLYNFIDDRENAWTWLYFHVLPIALFLWFIFTPDYSSFPALRISLLKPHCIVPLVLFTYAYFYQTGYAYYNSLYTRYCCLISPDKFIWIKDGVPGSGKSSSALVYAYVLAGKVWRDLCRKYWLYKNNPRKLLRDKVSAANWEEIKSAYLFWKRHPGAIPCLMSNISLMQGDRHVFQLTREHYLQQQRIPYGTVLFGDELDKLFPALSSMTKEERAELEPLRQLAGFTRHFGDFRWVYTTQQSSKIWNGVRDSAAVNEYMYSQDWVCRPDLLLWIYDLIMNRLEKKGYPDSPRLARFMWWLYSFVRKIGFRYYTTELCGNTERANVNIPSRKLAYAAPSRLPLTYDDRTFRKSYLAREQSVEDNRLFSELLAPPIISR